jgi:hypothetical protein
MPKLGPPDRVVMMTTAPLLRNIQVDPRYGQLLAETLRIRCGATDHEQFLAGLAASPRGAAV